MGELEEDLRAALAREEGALEAEAVARGLLRAAHDSERDLSRRLEAARSAAAPAAVSDALKDMRLQVNILLSEFDFVLHMRFKVLSSTSSTILRAEGEGGYSLGES